MGNGAAPGKGSTPKRVIRPWTIARNEVFVRCRPPDSPSGGFGPGIRATDVRSYRAPSTRRVYGGMQANPRMLGGTGESGPTRSVFEARTLRLVGSPVRWNEAALRTWVQTGSRFVAKMSLWCPFHPRHPNRGCGSEAPVAGSAGGREGNGPSGAKWILMNLRIALPPLALCFISAVGGAQVGGPYPVDPDSVAKPGVQHGTVTQMPKWHSRIFAGTEREWSVYVPAQYSADKPACVMIFQDGVWYKDFVPSVFDNLIAEKAMPVTVAVFVQPGTLLAGGAPRGNNQRSFEYDTLSDQYSKFLLEEILPEVEKTTKLRHDAASRAVAGMSSGGICAFTLAWQRPDQFGKVLSWIGSFTDLAAGSTGIEGGHNYPSMIRRTPPKPIRVFLQDGDHDLDNRFGNWPLANQEMAKALEFAHYDFKFVFGHGDHNPAHGRSILGESLRWLWRDFKID